MELIGNLNQGRVLDCGCGPAVVAEQFRGRGVTYYGVDISKEMLHEGAASRDRGSRSRFLQGVMERLPLRPETFDVVLCLGAFEYVIDETTAISNLARVTAATGTVILSMHNKWSPYRLWLDHVWSKIQALLVRTGRLVRRAGPTQAAPHAVIIVRTENEMRALCMSAGLEVEDVVYFDFNVLVAPLDRWLPRASVWLAERLEGLRRTPLRFLGSAYILKCRKRPGR
jgi:SAM-dependent methyltransferase